MRIFCFQPPGAAGPIAIGAAAIWLVAWAALEVRARLCSPPPAAAGETVAAKDGVEVQSKPGVSASNAPKHGSEVGATPTTSAVIDA